MLISFRFIAKAINDKNLDYEIETCVPAGGGTCFLRSINDKNLDYEIETGYQAHFRPLHSQRSMIRISITRLKLRHISRFPTGKCVPINDKNLDYEIETGTAENAARPIPLRSMIRISITRLKLIYEPLTPVPFRRGERSMIRISITRLKHVTNGSPRHDSSVDQ